MKASTKTFLGVAIGGLLIRDILKRAEKAIPAPTPASQLNGFIDPHSLGLGCDCDLGFVGCADMGVAPARSGVGALPTPERVVWDRTSARPKHWRDRNRRNFVLDGVGLAGFISPETEARLNDPNAYPWGSTGYNSGLDGLGRFSFKKFIAPVQKAVAKVAAPVQKVVKRAESDVKKAVSVPVTAIQKANKTIATQISKAANVIKTETYLKPKAVFGKKSGGEGPSVAADDSGRIVYQDENGNVISKAEYDRQMSQQYQSAPIVDPVRYNQQMNEQAQQEQQQSERGNLVSDPIDFAADEATGGSVYDNLQTDSGGTYDTANDQNWLRNQGDGFVSAGEGYNSGQSDGVSADGVITTNGVSWWQDTDGTWYWFDDTAQQWVQDQPDGTYVAEVSSPSDASAGDAQFDDSDDLGHLYDRRNGRPLAIVTRRRGGASINPLKVDGKGRVFASNGRKHRQVGTVDRMAKAEGQAGLGFSIFGRSFSKFSDFAKDVASKATPSGAIYKLVKRRSPSKMTEFHKVVKTATPYAAIVAGTVITVGSLGTASPAGVALIAAGVVQAGAQGYSDIKTHQAAKEIQAINDQSAAEVAAINAAPSPAARDAHDNAMIENQRLAQATYGAQNSDEQLPWISRIQNWWNGDIDEQSAKTYGEQFQEAGI